MLEPTDFPESSWTGPGMMEPMYPPATPTPPTSMPMREQPMGAPKPRPKKKKKASRPKAKKKGGKKRPKARAKRGGKGKRKRAAKKRRR